MPRMTWAEDRALDAAGAHGLSRSNAKRAKWRGRRRRGLHRGGGGGLGRGLLGGGLLSGLFGLLSGLLGLFKKKKVHRGRHARPNKGRKPKILRGERAVGIKRPVVRDQPRVTRQAGATRRPQVTYVTGVFDVRTGRIKRRRLLG